MVNRLTMPNKLSIFRDEVVHMHENMKAEITLKQLVARVESCSADEVDAVIDALQRRYRRLYPGWEVIFEAYPMKRSENHRNQYLTILKKQNDT